MVRKGMTISNEILRGINDLSDNIKATNSSMDSRVSVLESEISRLDKAVLSLTHLIKEESQNTHKIIQELELNRKNAEMNVLAKIDTVSEKLTVSSKVDWQVIIGLLSIVILLGGCFWGLAITPINNKHEFFEKSLDKTQSRLYDYENRFRDHEQLPYHSVSGNQVAHLAADIEKLELKLEKFLDEEHNKKDLSDILNHKP